MKTLLRVTLRTNEVLAEVSETGEPREAARDDKTNDILAANDDSDSEISNAICEVESNDGSASFVVSSIDSEEREDDGEEHEEASRGTTLQATGMKTIVMVHFQSCSLWKRLMTKTRWKMCQ